MTGRDMLKAAEKRCNPPSEIKNRVPRGGEYGAPGLKSAPENLICRGFQCGKQEETEENAAAVKKSVCV